MTKALAFSQRLIALRKLNGMTQADLADRLGISRSAIGNYEQARRDPDFEILDAVADLFDVDIGYLLGKNDSPQHYPGSRLRSVNVVNSALTDDERAVLEAYRAASKDIKGAVRAVLGVKQ